MVLASTLKSVDRSGGTGKKVLSLLREIFSCANNELRLTLPDFLSSAGMAWEFRCLTTNCVGPELPSTPFLSMSQARINGYKCPAMGNVFQNIIGVLRGINICNDQGIDYYS